MTRLSGLMKATLPICCVVVALLGLSCPFGAPLKISITANAVFRTGRCFLYRFLRVAYGKKWFELAVSESVTVTGIAEPIGIAAVSQ